MTACTRICFCPFFGMSRVILDEVAHPVVLLVISVPLPANAYLP